MIGSFIFEAGIRAGLHFRPYAQRYFSFSIKVVIKSAEYLFQLPTFGRSTFTSWLHVNSLF